MTDGCIKAAKTTAGSGTEPARKNPKLNLLAII
jgi:hypothetical protein